MGHCDFWINNYESVLKIVKLKFNSRRVNRNIPKRVWYFGMVWEAEINFRTAGTDGRPALERLTCDTIKSMNVWNLSSMT